MFKLISYSTPKHLTSVMADPSTTGKGWTGVTPSSIDEFFLKLLQRFELRFAPSVSVRNHELSSSSRTLTATRSLHTPRRLGISRPATNIDLKASKSMSFLVQTKAVRDPIHTYWMGDAAASPWTHLDLLRDRYCLSQG